jgi:hypothetical protein
MASILGVYIICILLNGWCPRFEAPSEFVTTAAQRSRHLAGLLFVSTIPHYLER